MLLYFDIFYLFFQLWDTSDSDMANETKVEKKDAPAPVKYLVEFYHDLSQNFFPRNDLRVIPKPIKGVVPGLGASVYARYSDGYYYRGVVDVMREYRIRVRLHEIGEEIEHDMDDPSSVILNLTPQYNQVKKHFKVIASKGDVTKGYHPGKVTNLEGEKANRLYSIKFEDGTTNQVPITKLVLMPKAPYDGKDHAYCRCIIL